MLRRVVAAAVALVAATGLTACATSGSPSDSNAASASSSSSSASSSSSSSSSSSRSSSSNAAVCRAADDLRAALTSLQQVDVVRQGTDALSQAFGQVAAAVSALADAARAQHAPQVQQVTSDVDAVKAALAEAKANPTASTIGAVGTAVGTLVQDAQTLLSAVGTSC